MKYGSIAVEHCRVDGRRRVVVEVDARHEFILAARDYNRGIPGVIMFEALLMAALLADGPAPDRGEALRDAARAGDLATVTRLLDTGARRCEGAAPRPDALLFAAGRAGSRSFVCWSSAEWT